MRRLLFPVALLIAGSCRAHAGEPTVNIVYSPRFDSVCSLVRGGEVKESWSKELADRKPEFGRLWAAEGQKLIDATEAITGKSFPARDFTARLTLCNLPSRSFIGIIVNMRFALRSFTSAPVPMRYKVGTLFHELLHAYFSEHPVARSKLLAEHAAEPARIRDHRHLLALQKAVLIRLGEVEALRDVIAVDSQLPDGYYKRAWQIVNASDAEYVRCVAEVQN
jgi:hypothetical protein